MILDTAAFLEQLRAAGLTPVLPFSGRNLFAAWTRDVESAPDGHVIRPGAPMLSFGEAETEALAIILASREEK